MPSRNKVRLSLPCRMFRCRIRAATYPQARPRTAPSRSCCASTRGRDRDSPDRRAMATAVSMNAMGSLDPDSTSSRESVWYFRASFRFRRMENTDAASVEDTTDPMRKLSHRGSPRTTWASPASRSADPATPSVDRTAAAPSTGRAACSLVPKPP
jgi:hypothetical protein